MLWLHRLQQRISITRHEALTLLSLSALLSLGLLVRYIQQNSQPIPPDAYEEADRLFSELSAELRKKTADSSGTRPDTTRSENRPAPRQLVRPIDLNRAGAAELETLPRIGPKTAEAIVAFREARGPFRSVDDLDAVKGIGPRTLDLLRPHLYVSRSDSS